MRYCLYFQAQVKRSDVWFFVATLRSFEHYAFDRTLDKQKSLFEFFVPERYEKDFTELMQYYFDAGIVSGFQKLENRLKTENF